MKIKMILIINYLVITLFRNINAIYCTSFTNFSILASIIIINDGLFSEVEKNRIIKLLPWCMVCCN